MLKTVAGQRVAHAHTPTVPNLVNRGLGVQVPSSAPSFRRSEALRGFRRATTWGLLSRNSHRVSAESRSEGRPGRCNPLRSHMDVGPQVERWIVAQPLRGDLRFDTRFGEDARGCMPCLVQRQ